MPSTPGCAMMGQKLFITRTNGPWFDLYERWWDGEEWLWVNHGRPQGLKVTSSPGAPMMNEKLFVVVEDGSLWERHWRKDLGRWAWESHGRPNNKRIVTAPSAPMMDEKLFVVTEDGSLWERHWRTSLGRWAWEDHGRPGNEVIKFAPGAAMMNQKLFVVTAKGNLWERHWQTDLGRWVWQSHGTPPGTKAASAPGAAMMDRRLFLSTSDGKLFERYWNGSAWVWVDHGKPTGTSAVGAPGAAMLNSKLFVTARNGKLFERYWNGSAWMWVDHGNPSGIEISTSPGAGMLDTKVFVGTANERMFELYWNGSAGVWVDHGTLMHDSCEILINNSGSKPKRTLAVVGDGFDERDLDRYKSWVQDELIEGVFNRDLIKECRSAFNVVRIDLVSIDSGVSQKRYDEHGTPNDPADDTVLSETFRWSRLGYVYSGSWAHCWLESKSTTNASLLKVLKRFCPNYDFILIVLNESGQGGCGGGGRQVVTLGENWSTIAHEFGHGMFNLDDEYQRSGKKFTGSSWSGPNCSVTANRSALKWADLVASSTSLPTTTTPSGWNDNTDVGAFEGCGTYEKNLYRPVKNCRMRSNTPPFCPVCSRRIKKLLQPYL